MCYTSDTTPTPLTKADAASAHQFRDRIDMSTRTSLDAAAAPARLPTELPCLNPLCGEVVVWSIGRGRPARFCGDVCRVAYSREKARLAELQRALEEVLESTALSSRQLLGLKSQDAHIRWALARYAA